MVSKEMQVTEEVSLPQKESLGTFLYNSDKGTVLGRTGLSWLKIGIFYAIFYACLCGWFAGLLNAFYTTLDEVAPTYYGNNSLTQNNPALGVRPMPVYDSTMIRFAQGKASSYKPYTDHLEAFFKIYEYQPDSLNCTGNETVSDDVGCNIDIQGYLADLGATRDNGYGYFDGSPVVVLKVNKLFEFRPNPYPTRSDIDGDLKEGEKVGHIAYGPGKVGISCDGQNAVDMQNIEKIDFAPSDGIDLKYYPYLNQKGYRSPVVLARFTKIAKRVTVQVTCRVWARNIDNSDGKEKRGTVHFEFYID